MSRGYNILNLFSIVVFIILHLNRSISAISCYECVSTFPSSSVCLPSCSQSYRENSTCLLTRNIPLEASIVGSLRAGHISEEPVISDATEKNFVYGEEAVYQNPSQAVGWDWEYGPITYGCDTPGCNNPQNVNRIPNALNARIPNETLNRLLTGDLDNSCYSCDLCLDENISGADISDCDLVPCPNHACNFVATRVSATGPTQCDLGWHFSSGCILSREPAQVDMTLMYYLRSKTMVLYQMEAICLSDNCNTFTTFKQLKDAITVDPDLSCFINDTLPITVTSTTPSTTTGTRTSSTTRSSSSTTTSSRSTTTTTTISSSQTTASTTTSSGGVTTTTTTTGRTSVQSTTTTTASGSSEQLFLNMKFFILLIFFFLFN